MPLPITSGHMGLREQHRRFASAPASSSFGLLGACLPLQDRLAALGINNPLPVQAVAVPAILQGRNAAIKSCTGSGKTLAYLLPLIQLSLERRAAVIAAAASAAPQGVTSAGPACADAPEDSGDESRTAVAPGALGGPDASQDGRDGNGRQTGWPSSKVSPGVLKQRARAVQALILAPSRELCIQVQRMAQELLPAGADRRLVQQLIGRANPRRQAQALAGGEGGVWPLVVVGTPGRVADSIAGGMLHVWGCPLLVLDEVDQLLDTKEVRAQVDTISSHVGRRVTDRTVAGRLAGAGPAHLGDGTSGSSTPPGGSQEAAARSAGAAASTSAAAAAGGRAAAMNARQTVIVSASLDARNPGRYARWCPDPWVIALDNRDALSADVTSLLPQEAQGDHNQQRPQQQQQQPAGPRQLHAATSSEGTSGGGVFATWSDSSTGTAPALSNAGGEATDPAPGPLSGVLPPHLVHLYVLAPAQHRTDYVRKAIHALGLQRALLFVPRQNQALSTKFKLGARNMEVTILHGRLNKMERGNIVQAFRQGVFRVLVTTDLAARGIDLPDCDAVINLGVPSDALSYAHRAGRTGRAGAPGVVVSVVTQAELRQLNKITGRLGLDPRAVSLSQGQVVPVVVRLDKATESGQGASGAALTGAVGPLDTSPG